MKLPPLVMANLSVPAHATEALSAGAEGVGLMRAEFLVYQTGKHPALLLEQGDVGLVAVLSDGMRRVADAFHPRKVLYRSLDLRSNDLRFLEGAEGYESEEGNPALGCRGIFRSRRQPRVFQAELEAIRRVRSDGYRSLQLMLPFVRWPEEVAWAREQCAISDMRRDDGFELWMMVETPAAILRADEFGPLVDGVSIGSNDLTQLVLGLDRDNEAFAQYNLDDDPAAVRAIQWAIESFRQLGVPISICGDAPSRSAKVLRRLIALSVDSVSVSPDRLRAVRNLLEDVEGDAREE